MGIRLQRWPSDFLIGYFSLRGAPCRGKMPACGVLLGSRVVPRSRMFVVVGLATYWAAFIAYAVWRHVLGYPVAWPEDRTLANILAFFALLGPIAGLMLVGILESGDKKVSPVQAYKKPDSPPPFRVDDLGTHVARMRRATAANEQAEGDRLQRLRYNWRGAAPVVENAVDLVNAQLSAHGMHLLTSGSDFMWPKDDPGGFGVTCRLVGAGRSLAYNGDQYVAASEKHLHVGGAHSWGDGVELSLSALSAGAIADILAENVKHLLEN